MEQYDIIIIGSGVAGLSAAMYAGRFSLKALAIGETPGGTILLTRELENYPGIESIKGFELADRMRAHAEKFGAKFVDEKAVSAVKKKGFFDVETASGKKFSGKSLILATGTEWRKLGVPGETEFTGKGVSYCALCDGAFFKGKTVGVVGGSDAAVKEALLLSEYASKVYLLVRSKIRAEPINLKRLEQNKKIEIVSKVNVKELRGSAKLSSVLLDREFNGSAELRLDGLFIEIGHIPLSQLASPLGVKLNERGEIAIDRNGKTSVPGVFAAGDVCDNAFKQAIIGAAQGVAAAYSAYQYLGSGEFVCHTEG